MNYKLPSILYLLRAILFVSVLLSLCFLSNATSAVIFLVAVAVNFCDFYITNKYMVGRIGNINSIIFGVIDRLIVLLPLLFMSITGILKVWVFLIVFAFESLMFLFRNFDSSDTKYVKSKSTIYIFYNLTIYISICCLLLNELTVGVYMLFVSTIISAVYVIMSSCTWGSGKNEDSSKSLPDKNSSFTKVENSYTNGEIVE